MIVDERYRAAEKLFEEVKERFPEVELVGVGPSPETDDLTVVKVILPDEDEREEAFEEFAANRATEILLETGDYIIVVSGLFEVVLEFKDVGGAARTVAESIRQLVNGCHAGEEVSTSTNLRGELSDIRCRLRSLDFARNELVERLDELGVLDKVEIFWVHPYRSGIYPSRTRLYPPEEG